MAAEIAERRLVELDDWVPDGLTGLRVPPSLHDLIRRRLRQLDPEHRAVLSAAAVTGTDFDGATVAAVADLDLTMVPRRTGPCHPGGLRAGGRVRLIAFASPVLQRVVHDDLSSSQRAVLEGRLGGLAVPTAAA